MKHPTLHLPDQRIDALKEIVSADLIQLSRVLVPHEPSIKHSYTLHPLPVYALIRLPLIPLAGRKVILPGPPLMTAKNPESILVIHINIGLDKASIALDHVLLNSSAHIISGDRSWRIALELVHYEVISSPQQLVRPSSLPSRDSMSPVNTPWYRHLTCERKRTRPSVTIDPGPFVSKGI